MSKKREKLLKIENGKNELFCEKFSVIQKQSIYLQSNLIGNRNDNKRIC